MNIVTIYVDCSSPSLSPKEISRRECGDCAYKTWVLDLCMTASSFSKHELRFHFYQHVMRAQRILLRMRILQTRKENRLSNMSKRIQGHKIFLLLGEQKREICRPLFSQILTHPDWALSSS